MVLLSCDWPFFSRLNPQVAHQETSQEKQAAPDEEIRSLTGMTHSIYSFNRVLFPGRQVQKCFTIKQILEIHQIKENTMPYTLDTKVGEILKDTRAVETLEKYAPGVSKNPMIGMAKLMSLKSLLAMPQAKQAGITEDMVLKVLAEINAQK
jgi:hypothetical protein